MESSNTSNIKENISVVTPPSANHAMVFGLSTWSQIGLNKKQKRVGVEDIVEGTIDRLIGSSESFIGSDGRPQVDYAPKILQILPGALFSQLREMSKEER